MEYACLCTKRLCMCAKIYVCISISAIELTNFNLLKSNKFLFLDININRTDARYESNVF